MLLIFNLRKKPLTPWFHEFWDVQCPVPTNRTLWPNSKVKEKYFRFMASTNFYPIFCWGVQCPVSRAHHFTLIDLFLFPKRELGEILVNFPFEIL